VQFDNYNTFLACNMLLRNITQCLGAQKEGLESKLWKKDWLLITLHDLIYS